MRPGPMRRPTSPTPIRTRSPIPTTPPAARDIMRSAVRGVPEITLGWAMRLVVVGVAGGSLGWVADRVECAPASGRGFGDRHVLALGDQFGGASQPELAPQHVGVLADLHAEGWRAR